MQHTGVAVAHIRLDVSYNVSSCSALYDHASRPLCDERLGHRHVSVVQFRNAHVIAKPQHNTTHYTTQTDIHNHTPGARTVRMWVTRRLEMKATTNQAGVLRCHKLATLHRRNRPPPPSRPRASPRQACRR